MKETKFHLFLLSAALLATAGCSESPDQSESESVMLYGEAYIPIEIRKYDPPLRFKNLELLSDHEEPEWLEVERITAQPLDYSFEDYAAAHASDSRINQLENAREKFEQFQAKLERIKPTTDNYIRINEVVQTLHYTFEGKEMMTFSLLKAEMTDKRTGETHKNTGRGLKLFTREDGKWKDASQQQPGPHDALFEDPEVQSEFIINDPATLTEGPLSWKRRKLIAAARPFQDQLEVSFAFENISDDDVSLHLEKPQQEQVLSAEVSPSTIRAGDTGTLKMSFDTSSRVNEVFTFTLNVGDQKQEAAVMVHAQNVLSINGQARSTMKLGATPPRLFTPILIENANIEVIHKPDGLSVQLIPNDSGVTWKIELEKIGEQATGEVLFRLTSKEGTAEATLVVEE